MIRLWGRLIRPIVDLVKVETLLEVGAEAGLSTRALAGYMSRRQGTLHCIDPYPDFDLEQFQADYPDVVFHQDLSLNVLPSLPPFDVGLLDGDHNWYTVFNELKIIEARHRECDAPFPLLFLHDTHWPYGRRDLYYNPANIPDEFRQPYAKKGIQLKEPELLENKGFNRNLYNAEQLGGEKNGVMTGIEDYVRHSSLSLKQISLPIFHGLTILISSDRLESNHELSDAISHLSTTEGMMEILALCEHIRCADGVVLQSMLMDRASSSDDDGSAV